jgi:hypothetical protein
VNWPAGAPWRGPPWERAELVERKSPCPDCAPSTPLAGPKSVPESPREGPVEGVTAALEVASIGGDVRFR